MKQWFTRTRAFRAFCLAAAVLFFGSVLGPGPAIAQSSNPDTVLAKARLFYETGKYQEALDELKGLIASGEEFKPHIMVEIYKYLAFCSSAFDQRDVAKRNFMKALTYDPNLELDPVFTSPKIMSLFKEAKRDFLEEYQKKMAEEERKLRVPVRKTLPKAAPKPGSLEVTANVVNARVYLDGRKIGLTPMDSTETLMPGEYAVKVVKEGYQSWESQVTIASGKKELIIAQLTKLKKPWYKKAWVWGIAAGVIGGGVAATAIAGGGGDENGGGGDTHADVIVHY